MPSVLMSLLMLFALALPLYGCASGSGGAASETEVAVEEDGQAESSSTAEEDGGGTEAADGDAAASTSDGRVAWASECLSRHGEVSAYAVSELSGRQLQELMRQNGYIWSTRNQCWLKDNGSAAVVVYGADGEALASEQIDELGRGAQEKAASYRLVSSRYGSAERAFDYLASRVMTCEDSEFAGDSGVAVVAGPSLGRCIVLTRMGDEVATVTIAGEDAIAAGLLDTMTGRELGSTVDEVFETLAGRVPGAER